FPGIPQQLPGCDVLAVPNPNIEVRVDPRGREDSTRGAHFPSRRERLACGERAKIRVSFDALVELAQEFAPVTGIVFPGIFTIEKERDRQWLGALHALSERTQTTVQILRRGLSVHSAVDETDQVGKMVIPEETRDCLPGELYAPRFVEFLRIRGNAAGVAKKSDVERSSEHAFVGAEPLEAFLRSEGERLIGYRTL